MLNDNRISGDIPAALMNLDTLLADQSNLCNNSLSTADDGLRDFLNDKTNPDWTSCQQIALTLDKSSNPADYDEVGDTIQYNFLVTNTGTYAAEQH